MGNVTACLSGATTSASSNGGGEEDHLTFNHSLNPEGYSFSYHLPLQLSTAATTTNTFKYISGASVSANTSTPSSSTTLLFNLSTPPNGFHSTPSFLSGTLLPVPPFASGPIPNTRFMSGPLEDTTTFMSGPLTGDNPPPPLRRSFSQGGGYPQIRSKVKAIRRFRKAIGKTIVSGHNSIVAPITGVVIKKMDDVVVNGGEPCMEGVEEEEGLHWAQGRAGEDRVHVAVSEDHGLLFVGIYDGFNGPDATDYLLSNLYSAVHAELKGFLWEEPCRSMKEIDPKDEKPKKKKKKNRTKKKSRRTATREGRRRKRKDVEDDAVLEALSRALLKTEGGFLGVADNMVSEHPELALMGSCVLVMLMRGDHVYLMNVGDSRAILAREPVSNDVEGIKEETKADGFPWFEALQLTMDHSTGVAEEVERIRKEHPDEALAVTNDRVKGSLKVTRAFGAGYLKQPKWNSALFGSFRVDYIGTSPYITCTPYLRHYELGPRDQFLILSSDGLYQHLSNEEVVSEVQLFLSTTPDGNPAQHLVEEAMFLAAERAGLDFHGMLQIPQGERRRIHDDISVIVISLEGRMWQASS